MKNTLKRISAIALALVMVLALGTTAFAATGPDNTSGNFGSTTGESTGGTFTGSTETWSTAITSATFNVHFDVDATNSGNRPATQFSYSIDNGTRVAATSTAPEIKAGITGGATIPTAVTDAWNAPNATDAVDTIGVSFDASKFTAPGIYRYIITEAALTQEQTDIGIADGDTSGNKTENTLYLDVYVSKLSGASDLSVVAAVLLTTAETPSMSNESGTIAGTNETASYTTKIDGFYNSYKAYTVTVTKTVAGDAGDSTFYFPFSMVLAYTEGADANTTITGVTVTATATSNSTVGTTYAIGNGTGNTYSDITIKDGGTVTISGLPMKSIIKLYETVDAGEGYIITSAITGMEAGKTVITIANKHTETSADIETVGTVNDDATQTMAYTNTRYSISPTGVVLRIAPYAFILGAGIVLLVLSKKRKEEEA